MSTPPPYTESPTQEAPNVMANQNRSSREYKESALDRDRRAKEDAERRRSLQAQIAELVEKERAAEESEKQHREQAEADRKAAVRECFQEISLVKQAEFRSNLAREVYTRVARTLYSEEDRDYIKAIAEGDTSLEDPQDFKLMLWDAIAGNDSQFFQNAAQEVVEALTRDINDADVEEIETSNVCLSAANAVPTSDVSQSANNNAMTHPLRHSSEPLKVAAQASLANLPNSSAANLRHADKQGQLYTKPPVNGITRARYDGCNGAGRLVKQENTYENNCNDRRRHMSEIDRDDVNMDSVEASQDSIVSKSNDVSIKRKRDDDCSSNANAKTTPKKAKVAESPTRTSGAKFAKHIGELARNGNLSLIDFLCSKCGKDVKNPRMASTCHHLYCFECFKTIRGNRSGKDLAKVVCCRADCGRPTGSASMISGDEVQAIKKFYPSSSKIASEDKVQDDRASNSDTESNTGEGTMTDDSDDKE